MVGVDGPRKLFEFSPSRIAKMSALVKSFVRNLKHHLRRETMKSVYFETLRRSSRENNNYSKETLMK